MGPAGSADVPLLRPLFDIQSWGPGALELRPCFLQGPACCGGQARREQDKRGRRSRSGPQNGLHHRPRAVRNLESAHGIYLLRGHSRRTRWPHQPRILCRSVSARQELGQGSLLIWLCRLRAGERHGIPNFYQDSAVSHRRVVRSVETLQMGQRPGSVIQ